MLEADDDLIQRSVRTDIFMSPPADPCCSDGDSGDEDNGGTYNNLSGRQLDADAVATVRTMTSAVHIGDEDNCDDEEEQPMPVPPPARKKRVTKERPASVQQVSSDDEDEQLAPVQPPAKNKRVAKERPAPVQRKWEKRIYPNKADTSPIHSPISMLHLT